MADVSKKVATTIGLKVLYAFETVAGTRPTTGYIQIPGITSTPDLNAAPDTIDTTSYDNVHNKTSVPGLVDFGNMEFGTFLTEELYDIYYGADGNSGLMAAYETAEAAGKKMWLCINAPSFTHSFYIPVIPHALGFPSSSGTDALKPNLIFTADGDYVWAADPTDA